jgi:hypothetical protein
MTAKIAFLAHKWQESCDEITCDFRRNNESRKKMFAGYYKQAMSDRVTFSRFSSVTGEVGVGVNG